MNILVADRNLNCNGFLRLSSLQDAADTKGSIDFLVYNRSNETSENKVMYLNALHERSGTIVYICDKDHTEEVIKMLVIGYGGKYFDDEYFLSGDELINMMRSLGEVTQLVQIGGVSVLSDFLKRYLDTGSTSFSKMYLMSVKEAVHDLVEDYNKKNLEMIRMSESATELFTSTSEVLENMRTEHDELQKLVLKMEREIKKVSVLPEVTKTSTAPTRSNSIVFFPRVAYLKERNILRIKELGSTRYLTSFVLGLRNYLENIKNVRPKLIIIEPISFFYEEYYSEFNWINQNNTKNRKLFYNNVVFTNCPTKEVLTTLLDDTEYDTFIVVDRLKEEKEHILNSKGKRYYAIGSPGILEKFKIPPRDSFTSIENLEGVLFQIKSDSDYPTEKVFRERYYLNNYGYAYDLLYNS